MAKTWKSYKEESKADYLVHIEGDLRKDQLEFGAILRIADAAEKGVTALEKMASSYDILRMDRDCYRQWHKEGMEDKKVMLHQIAGLRGYIGRLKRKEK